MGRLLFIVLIKGQPPSVDIHLRSPVTENTLASSLPRSDYHKGVFCYGDTKGNVVIFISDNVASGLFNPHILPRATKWGSLNGMGMGRGLGSG